MKNMKLYMLCGVLVLGLAACQAQKESVAPLPTGEAAVEAQASVFQSLRMANGNALAVSLEATPTETETPFFYIEAARDTEVTLYYNFTKEAGDAQIGCYADGSKEKMVRSFGFLLRNGRSQQRNDHFPSKRHECILHHR